MAGTTEADFNLTLVMETEAEEVGLETGHEAVALDPGLKASLDHLDRMPLVKERSNKMVLRKAVSRNLHLVHLAAAGLDTSESEHQCSFPASWADIPLFSFDESRRGGFDSRGSDRGYGSRDGGAFGSSSRGSSNYGGGYGGDERDAKRSRY